MAEGEPKETAPGPSSAWPNSAKDYELKEQIGVGATAVVQVFIDTECSYKIFRKLTQLGDWCQFSCNYIPITLVMDLDKHTHLNNSVLDIMNEPLTLIFTL